MAQPSIAILNYGLGNLFSVSQAFNKIGQKAEIISDPQALAKFDALVVPGVGAFGDAMERLNSSGQAEAVEQYVKQGKPLLGICLGLQLMFSSSEEHGSTNGFNFIKGQVRKFPSRNAQYSKINIPNIGWRTLQVQAKNPKALLFEGQEKKSFYFVHSYVCDTQDQEAILCRSEYMGENFVAGISKNNLTGFQFHPEKSSWQGLKLYESWLKSWR